MDPPEIRMTRLIASSQVNEFNTKIPIRLYFRSGHEILRMANIYKDEGDDERAFQLFLRYIELFLEKMVLHPGYKEYDALEKEEVKRECKKLFPLTEELKAHIRKKYENEYKKYLESEVSELSRSFPCLTVWNQEEKRRMYEMQKEKEAEVRLKEEATRQREQQEDLERRMKEAKERTVHGMNKLSLSESKGQDFSFYSNMKEAKERTVHGMNKLSLNESKGQDFSFYSNTNGPSAPRASPTLSFESSVPRPRVDRGTKPSSESINSINSISSDILSTSEELRKVVVPLDLKDAFLIAAKSNTTRNVETGGILAGKLSKNEFTITTVIIPKQEGCSDSFSTLKEEEIFDYQIEHDLITLGWIHTHPSQSAFMSSIDLHTHCSYQILLPEAIAIVVAPSYDETKIFSLTPDVGLPIISNCPKTGFHPHPNDTTLYCTCSHVTFEDSRKLQTILFDLRN